MLDKPSRGWNEKPHSAPIQAADTILSKIPSKLANDGAPTPPKENKERCLQGNLCRSSSLEPHLRSKFCLFTRLKVLFELRLGATTECPPLFPTHAHSFSAAASFPPLFWDKHPQSRMSRTCRISRRSSCTQRGWGRHQPGGGGRAY